MQISEINDKRQLLKYLMANDRDGYLAKMQCSMPNELAAILATYIANYIYWDMSAGRIREYDAMIRRVFSLESPNEFYFSEGDGGLFMRDPQSMYESIIEFNLRETSEPSELAIEQFEDIIETFNTVYPTLKDNLKDAFDEFRSGEMKVFNGWAKTSTPGVLIEFSFSAKSDANNEELDIACRSAIENFSDFEITKFGYCKEVIA